VAPPIAGLTDQSSTTKYFSTKLDISANGLMEFTQQGSMWAAAKADAMEKNMTTEEYLTNIETSSERFRAGDEFWDRDMLLTHMHKAMEDCGSFTLLVLEGKKIRNKLINKTYTYNFLY
jgi:hypothetical protein